MRIVNNDKAITKTLGELKGGDCYMFHGRIYMKIELPCPESTEEEKLVYVVDPSNGSTLSVKETIVVKPVDPTLTY